MMILENRVLLFTYLLTIWVSDKLLIIDKKALKLHWNFPINQDKVAPFYSGSWNNIHQKKKASVFSRARACQTC